MEPTLNLLFQIAICPYSHYRIPLNLFFYFSIVHIILHMIHCNYCIYLVSNIHYHCHPSRILKGKNVDLAFFPDYSPMNAHDSTWHKVGAQ